MNCSDYILLFFFYNSLIFVESDNWISRSTGDLLVSCNSLRMRPSLVVRNMESAREWVRSLSGGKLPRQAFQVTFSRASGPGGQKVNKTSSKSTITLPNLRDSEWIPEEVRSQLIQKGFRYLTKSTSVVISSDSSRSQQENLDLCFDKFCNEVRKTVHFAQEVSQEDQKKWAKIQKKTNEKRLIDKKFKSQKKQSRKVSIY